MYMKKYTNTFILTELPKTDKLIISEILKEIKTFKDNIITVNAENDLLSLEISSNIKILLIVSLHSHGTSINNMINS